MKNSLFPILLGFTVVGIAITSHVSAASVLIRWQNSTGYELKDQVGTFLGNGELATPGDGTALELGYYSLATTNSPFAGDWIPFTGPSSLEGQATTIGDKFQGLGLFSIGSQYHTELHPFILDAVGHPLSIRFYDQLVGQTPQFFNAVSSISWVLQPLPEDSVLLMTMDLSQVPLLWQGGQATNSTFKTNLTIPEPGCWALIGLSSICLFFRRRANSRY